MRQKVLGFFKFLPPKSTPPLISDIDREVIISKRNPIGTTLEVEQKRIEDEIAQIGQDAMVLQLEKEAVALTEINKRLLEINKKSEAFLPKLENQQSSMKEAIKQTYMDIQKAGLDFNNNKALYETQGTLRRRQMVIEKNPNLLNLDYNIKMTETKY
ncbi:MAG: hypothetical protein K2X50_04415 [Gammaproteobacteria bacterium]|nr:hypothetical protein [Gammaproteobacteria bacterium]